MHLTLLISKVKHLCSFSEVFAMVASICWWGNILWLRKDYFEVRSVAGASSSSGSKPASREWIKVQGENVTIAALSTPF